MSGFLLDVPVLDAFLAATALAHDLVVVSRDEVGFRNTGVRLLNPFSKLQRTGE
jgi:predicted nucleic acid-binding protein